MGNSFFWPASKKQSSSSGSGSRVSRRGLRGGVEAAAGRRRIIPPPDLPHQKPILRKENPTINMANSSSTSKSSYTKGKKGKYGYIPDNFSSLDQVTAALRESGLESSNLILGIDFTKSNEWTGKKSFSNKSLHAIGAAPNPYEKAISIIGKTLAPFDEDNLIPCFGFGDVTTHDQEVFSFHNDHSPCHGFEEVLACYKRINPHLQLSGPTSYGPIVDAAVDIVERTGGQYHVLVIIADGQVTRSVNTSDVELSPQEERTINSIVNARQPRSRAKRIVPRPPPVPYAHRQVSDLRQPSNLSVPLPDESNQQVCPVCLTNGKNMAFGCGHMTCGECASKLSNCPICRLPITSRLRLYT